MNQKHLDSTTSYYFTFITPSGYEQSFLQAGSVDPPLPYMVIKDWAIGENWKLQLIRSLEIDLGISFPTFQGLEHVVTSTAVNQSFTDLSWTLKEVRIAKLPVKQWWAGNLSGCGFPTSQHEYS